MKALRPQNEAGTGTSAIQNLIHILVLKLQPPVTIGMKWNTVTRH